KDAGNDDLQRQQDGAEKHPVPGTQIAESADDHATPYSSVGRVTTGGRAVERRGAAGASEFALPKTSLAMAPTPPSDPMSEAASKGISTILLLLEEPMVARASVYFCATK